MSGTVAKVADFGVFVRLPGGLEGLMHISETNLPRGRKLSEFYHPEDPIRVRILRIEVEEQRIGLSSRDVPEEEPHAVEEEARAVEEEAHAPEAEPSPAEAAGAVEPEAEGGEASVEGEGEDEAAKPAPAEPSE